MLPKQILIRKGKTMRVTVKDCLKLESFRRALVVAGESGLEKRIKGISVMDAQSVNEAVMLNGQPETMVLTTFAGMKSDGNLQVETIAELAKAGISALVFFQRDKTTKAVENAVVEAADKAGLPFIIMADSAEMGYTAIMEEIVDLVNNGNDFKNSLISNTIFHLLNFEKHSNFQQALREAAINNGFQVILLSEEFNPVFVVETRYKTTINEAIRRGKEMALNLGNSYSLIDINGVLTYWGVVNINEDRYYLIIVDNDDNYSAAEVSKLAEIVELAMGMWKFTPERDAKSEFVKALMRGNKSLAYSLRTEADIKAGDILSVFYAENLETHHADGVLNKFMAEGHIDVIRVSEDNETYGVILKGHQAKAKEDNEDKAGCIALFDSLKSNKSVRIFHVTGIDGIEGAADGFRLVGETWSFMESVFPYKRVFSKYELALVSNCISIQVQGGQLKKNYTDFLEPFRKEGDNKARQLLETLETFVLDAGMNSSKTSEFMGIHTNTVQYRLKKINEILGVEITGNRVIPGLTVALALKRMEKAVK